MTDPTPGPATNPLEDAQAILLAEAQAAVVRARAAVEGAGAEGRALAKLITESTAGLIPGVVTGKIPSADVELAVEALRRGVSSLGWWAALRAERIAARESLTTLSAVLRALAALAAAA